jgi:hypothetical protein
MLIAMPILRGRWTRPSILVVALSVALVACDSSASSTPVTTRDGSSPRATTGQAATTAPGEASPSPAPTSSHGASTGGSAARPGLPDRILTPGARNPDVNPADLGSTICKVGWTKTVRPPTSYTNALKRKQIGQYGYADTDLRDYEEDHLIPLEVGGAPRDPRNLWPEPRSATLPDGTKVGATQKDGLENYLHAQVCHGRISLAAAQDAFARDWVAAWEAAGRP